MWADFGARQDPFASAVASVVPGNTYSGNLFGQITASYRGALTGTATITWALLYPKDGLCEDAIALDQGVAPGSRRRVMLTQTRTFSYNGEDVELPGTAGLTIPNNAPAGTAQICAQIVSATSDNDLSDNVVVSEDTVNVQ